MKVLHFNYSDVYGGASRASYRIHHALRNLDIDSHMLVNVRASGDWTVHGPVSKWCKLPVRVRSRLVKPFCSTLRTGNSVIHSPAILPSSCPAQVNTSDTDMIHLHWVAGEMLSIADIGLFKKPVIWTLHDMWAFCGAEHYTEEFRWREGYRRNNRPSHESGFDLNRWTWNRKRKHWTKPIHIVAPSNWLAECARNSVLMRDWPVSVIPNCIDTDRWHPLNKTLARELLGLPTDVPLLLFGAMGGSRDPRKGFDLLLAALDHLRGELKDLHLVIFGQLPPRDPPELGFPVYYTGHLHDDLTLRALYSAADALVVPSRQDNLPNTGVESQACGTPVVAFNTCGLPDIVDHRYTGYLATPFEVEDLAEGIRWVIEEEPQTKLSVNARERAAARFSYAKVAQQYVEVYESALHQ